MGVSFNTPIDNHASFLVRTCEKMLNISSSHGKIVESNDHTSFVEVTTLPMTKKDVALSALKILGLAIIFPVTLFALSVKIGNRAARNYQIVTPKISPEHIGRERAALSAKRSEASSQQTLLTSNIAKAENLVNRMDSIQSTATNSIPQAPPEKTSSAAELLKGRVQSQSDVDKFSTSSDLLDTMDQRIQDLSKTTSKDLINQMDDQVKNTRAPLKSATPYKRAETLNSLEETKSDLNVSLNLNAQLDRHAKELAARQTEIIALPLIIQSQDDPRFSSPPPLPPIGDVETPTPAVSPTALDEASFKQVELEKFDLENELIKYEVPLPQITEIMRQIDSGKNLIGHIFSDLEGAITHSLSLPLEKQREQIRDLVWYLQSYAMEKGDSFKQGTFIYEGSHEKLNDFLMAHYNKENPAEGIVYYRPQSHLKGRVPESGYGYGIDFPPGPNGVQHVLFAKIDNGDRLFFKPEDHGVSSYADTFFHAIGFIRSQGRKNIPSVFGTDEAEGMRKERVPPEALSLFKSFIKKDKDFDQTYQTAQMEGLWFMRRYIAEYDIKGPEVDEFIGMLGPETYSHQTGNEVFLDDSIIPKKLNDDNVAAAAAPSDQ